jgi:hypothetical protein
MAATDPGRDDEGCVQDPWDSTVCRLKQNLTPNTQCLEWLPLH